MVNYGDCPQRSYEKLPKYPGDVVECDGTEHILVNRVPGIIRYKNHDDYVYASQGLAFFLLSFWCLVHLVEFFSFRTWCIFEGAFFHPKLDEEFSLIKIRTCLHLKTIKPCTL